MKKLKAVEATRKQYHQDPNVNSVHRSSLMVPEISGTAAEISFLNHFLLKRNHKKIACIITAINFDGKKIQSQLQHIDEPRVYRFTLTGMVNQPVSNYLIEFYSVENLFFPYPAVMVNHVGNGFVNQVHSFNRVLNDIFEDDEINAHQVNESSVDLIINNDIDTCLLFTAGPMKCKGPLNIEILTKDKTYKNTQQLDLSRFGIKKVSIKETFPDLQTGTAGVIKAMQPPQLLFYGRLLSGQWTKNGAFSANHTYYDSSTVEEYWDNSEPSSRFYPFFKELTNSVRLYPIMSPSELSIFITPTSSNGSLLDEIFVGKVKSPGNEFVNVNINKLLEKEGINYEKMNTYVVTAKTDSGKMPTRIGHQIVYGVGGLGTSINVVLNNPNIFVPEGRKSFKWGQTIVGGDFDTFVGIVADPSQYSEIKEQEFIVGFYDTTGKLTERKWKIPNGTAVSFSVETELRNELVNLNNKNPEYIWCTIEGEKHGLNFFAISYNKLTKHCSGDHGF